MGVVFENGSAKPRAAANNTLGLFSEHIAEKFLRDIDDEEALAELSETGEFSEQADEGDNYND